MRTFRWPMGQIVFALGVVRGFAAAQEEPPAEPERQTASDALEALDQRVRVLERKLELEKEAAEARTKESPVVTAGKDGFSFRSADGSFQLKLRGYVHADARFYPADDDELLTDTFVLRRVRPIFEGTFFRVFDFRIMPDFGGGTTVLQDAYLDTKFLPELKLRVGKFKPPVGLERLQSATDIRFVERAYPTALVPNRDVGAQLFGDLFEDVISYQVGVFNGVVDGGSGDLDSHDEKDYAARVFAHPFRRTEIDALSGLGIGVAGTLGNQQGALPNIRSVGQATIFTYANGVSADGLRWRASPQLYYYWNSFGLLAEYALSDQEVKLGNDTQWVRNEAWQIAATYLLTGEANSYRSPDPRNPVDFNWNGWGVWELAARWTYLRVDQDAFPLLASTTASVNKANELSGGVNWYLNRNVKLALDYAWTEFQGGASGGGDREHEQVIFARIQLAF